MSITVSKEDFLRQLEASLIGRVSDQVVQENIRYYRSYINEQICGGKSEAEVLDSLGDPRLIAKTIEGSSRFVSGGRTVENGYTGSYGGAYQENHQEEPQNHAFHQVNLPGWLAGCILVAVVVFVLILVFKAFVFLVPFILVFILASVIVRIVRSWFGES